MDSPLVYLTLCSMRNRASVRLRRLREPRYLLGSVVGIAYFALVFYRPSSRRPRSGAAAGVLDQMAHSQTAVPIAAVVLLVLLALAWLWPSSRRPALAFTRADVQWLFTAPIERWRLVRYKVLRSQLGAFFGSAVVTLFMRPATLPQAWTFLLGFALITAVINLHLTGISLTRVREGIADRGVVSRWLPGAIVAAAVAIVAGDVVMRWQAIAAAAAGDDDVMSAIGRLLSSGPSGVVLWPLAMLARLPLSRSPLDFATALPWTMVVIGLNYVWVLRTDAPFEEGSAELSEKLARVRKEGAKALRAPRPVVATPFPLAPRGALETAILWKNLISMGRFLSWTTFVRFVPAVIVPVVLLARGGGGGPRADVLAFASLMVVTITVWLGPQITRADLRQDLSNLAVLRTWPLRGATLVRGEVLAPALVLVAVAWTALLAATIFSTYGSARMQIDNPWSYLIASMAIAPGVILIQLLVQNALAVTFPSWVTIGPARGGIDVMGQRMLLMVGSILALLVAALPAAIVGGILFVALRWLTGGAPIVLPGLAAAAVLLGEALVGSELVGAIFDRTDVTALDPADA
jgi:hypothetical protein